MKYFRFFLLALVIGLLGGCARAPQNEPRALATGSAPSPQSQHFPKDDLGREIYLKKPAERVVCIGPGATETIFALGAGKKLVGRDQISDYPKETKNIPIAGDYTGPFVEKVIALKPDLVIVQGETYDRARAENWQQKIGAPVAVLVPTSMKKVGFGMQKIGAWLGVKKEADKLSESFMIGGPTWACDAFFEIQRSPLWTAGEGTLVQSLMEARALTNALNVKGYKQVNVEELLAVQPRIYIVPGKPSDREKIVDELRKHPVLGKLKCIREGRVAVVTADYVLRPGPRLLNGGAELYIASRKYRGSLN